ncbi:ATP-binding cassette domain-containing protein [Sediminibacterium sp.]|uniref:ATP-binding cassette domain-containing protein n=1 Tax=Sediminibacterium sp. TaxID=1917865 RepID=UPI002733F45A|nr:ATP-binding cassette domain-containing protein [Sediminibacterium sp.]MDP3568961.1 ATP-binding cassette domain-containing protein [Sediminibacterium sp.]
MRHSLEVDSIILEFGTKRLLQDVYLKNETGKITGILGRNGSGKTCLLNIIYGELDTNEKSIRLNGKAIFNGFRNPDNFRYLPQFSYIPKNLKVERIFKDFELDFPQFADHFPEFEKYYKIKLNRLSGGEHRIIEIYSILASKTKFCMLDEPFSQIMPVHIETLKTILKNEKKNKGIIITDHLYEHVTEICDDLYVIANGKTYLTRDLDDLKTLGYTNK